MKQGAIIEEIGGEPASGSEGTGSQTWHDTYSVLQWAEIESNGRDAFLLIVVKRVAAFMQA